MTTNTTNSQAASIDTPEFDDLLLTYWECRNHGESYAANERAELIAYIDAKLAQAVAAETARCQEIADARQRGWDSQWDAQIGSLDLRTEKAETRLAEIQRGVEGLMRWTPTNEGDMMPWDDGNFIDRDDALALLAPQGQADTSGLPG